DEGASAHPDEGSGRGSLSPANCERRPYGRSDTLRLAIYPSSVRFVCNGALPFHAPPGTHVANIHKTPLNRRAFFCFHRLITAGTSDDRRAIHSILHNQPHRSC